MTEWVTSDLHFSHGPIIRMCRRPFSDVGNMNRLLVMNWNEVVAPDDVVYVLGDVVMGERSETLPVVEKLNGIKLLVPGNHDRCWSHDKAAAKWVKRYEDVGLEVLDDQVELQTDRGPVLMCHFPYEADDRHGSVFADYHPKDEGLPLLHGHVHQDWKVKGRQVNVGTDVWGYYPIKLNDAIALATEGAS